MVGLLSFVAPTQTTLTFTDAQAAPGFFGFFDTTTDDPGNRVWISGQASDWTGVISGASASMAASTGGGDTPFWVSVDNGAWVNQTLTAGVSPIFSGLPDAPHQVRIRVDGSFAGFAFTPLTGAAFSVTGANPSISFLGTTQSIITDPSFPGEVMAPRLPTPSFGSGFDVQPEFQEVGFFDVGAVQIKFVATTSEIWLYTADTVVGLSIDGSTLTYIDLPAPIASVMRGWQLLASGLDASAPHTYLIASGFNIPNVAAGAIQGPPTWGVKLNGTFGDAPTSERVIQYGDSITFGAGASSSTEVDIYKIAPFFGFVGLNEGISGRTTAELLTDLPGIRSSLNGLIEDVAIVSIGRNDTAGSAFVTSYTGVVNALIAAGVPKILCRGINFGNAQDGTGAGLAAIDADIQSALAAIGSSKVSFVDVTTWVGIEGVDPNDPPGDGTHPTDNGYTTMVGFEQTAYAPFFT